MEITDHTTKLESASEFSGGFSFDLFHRNENLIKQLGSENVGHIPKAFKTGTTIVGIIYKDGIVLGADTRATGDSNVMDKNCAKIHYLAPNIFCCGAGTAADTEKVTELIASNLELLRLSTGTQSRVVTALTLLKRMLHRYQGHIGAALIVGGCDVTGPCLYSIQPHGSSQMLPYHTMGSGSLAAMAVFETRYTEDIEENAAIELVKDSVRAGIFNDLGSGSNIDVTVIRRSGEVSRLRNIENAAGSSVDYKSKFQRPNKLNIPIGATYVISETFKPHKKVETAAVATAMEVV